MTGSPLTVTVSQLAYKISSMIGSEPTFRDICIKGEVSGLRVNAQSGHVYFDLKDENAVLSAVLFKWVAAGISVKPENGMAVTVRGTVETYAKSSRYQIRVADVSVQGAGTFSEAFEKLKKKLEGEGLFAQKRPLPQLPRKICLITSESGAVIHDLLTNIERRCPTVKIVFIPAAVQGEKAPESLKRAIEKANRTDADLIIFGRGGGSSEDLSAFNDESLARAIFASRIPTISAVGHDTDISLSDMVADRSAPTPSTAAEYAVPDMRELLGELEEKKDRIAVSLRRVCENKTVAVRLVSEKIKGRSPLQRLNSDEQRLGSVYERLRTRMKLLTDEKSRQSENAYSLIRMRTGALIDAKERSFAHTAAVINALDPLSVLLRGYSITYSGEKALKSADDVREGDRLRIKLSEGMINAVVESTEKE